MEYIPNTTIKLNQSDRYRMSSDSLHLIAFMHIKAHDRVCDVGTNNGVLALAAASRTDKTCIGIDIDESSLQLARENAAFNQLENLSFECVSVQDYKPDRFDVVICNPPYHSDKNHQDDVMQFDHQLNLDDLAKHGYRILKGNARLFLVIKAYRMMETIITFKKHRFSLHRMQMIHHSLQHQASSVCMEFRKSVKDHLIIDPPIINQLEKD